jgi:hypothetical protein
MSTRSIRGLIGLICLVATAACILTSGASAATSTATTTSSSTIAFDCVLIATTDQYNTLTHGQAVNVQCNIYNLSLSKPLLNTKVTLTGAWSNPSPATFPKIAPDSIATCTFGINAPPTGASYTFTMKLTTSGGRTKVYTISGPLTGPVIGPSVVAPQVAAPTT